MNTRIEILVIAKKIFPVAFRVWVPPPYPTGAPWGPHSHPPWGWGIEFEKPPWGFGGVFHAFL